MPAAMRDVETLLHGHLAGMDERTGVVADPHRAGGRAMRARAAPPGVCGRSRELGRTAGAILGERATPPAIPAALTPAGRLVVPAAPRPAARRRWRCLGRRVPLQLLTERIARVRGVNPDPIRRDDPRVPRGRRGRRAPTS